MVEDYILKMNKVLFIALQINDNTKYYMPNNPGYLISIIEEQGWEHDTYIINTTAELFQLLKLKDEYQYIFVSVQYGQQDYLNLLPNFKKHFTKAQIVLGGIYVVNNIEHLLEKTYWDILCYGEGEFTIKDLLNNVPLDKVRNIYWRNNQIIKNDYEKLLDLSDWPMPSDNIKNKDLKQYKSIFIAFNRGCYNHCAFCCEDYIRQKFDYSPKEYYRKRDPKAIGEYLKQLFEKYDHFKYIKVTDSIFVNNDEWTREMIQIFKEVVSIPYRVTGYIGNCSKEMIDLLCETTCDNISLEIITWNEKYRKEVLHRNYSNEKIFDLFEYVKSKNLLLYSAILLGFPNETIDEMWYDIKQTVKAKPDVLSVNIFYPFNNIELYEQCKNSLISDYCPNNWNETQNKLINFEYDSIIQSSKYSHEKFQKELSKMYKYLLANGYTSHNKRDNKFQLKSSKLLF